jgi:hypothetical protein
MRARVIEFSAAQADRTRAPLVSAAIWTPAGVRIYTSVGMTDQEIWILAAGLFDGSWTLGGSQLLGAQFLPVIAREARVLSFGTVSEEAAVAATLGMSVGSLNYQGDATLTCRNDDDHFGKALAKDTFLSAKLNYVIGWRGLRRDLTMRRFQGTIRSITLSREQCVLQAQSA